MLYNSPVRSWAQGGQRTPACKRTPCNSETVAFKKISLPPLSPVAALFSRQEDAPGLFSREGHPILCRARCVQNVVP